MKHRMNSALNAYGEGAGSGTSSVNWITVLTQIAADHSSRLRSLKCRLN